jgi:two-component system, cell cycle response regulator
VLEAESIRQALARGLPMDERTGPEADALRQAPVLIALCDTSGAESGRPAAWVAASQMALVAEEAGLSALLIPWRWQTPGASELPLPPGSRLETVLAIGLPGPPDRRPESARAPRGVESFVAAASPPTPSPTGREEREVLNTFLEIAAATAGVEDLDEILNAIANALGRLFPVDGASLGLLEEEAIVVREILRRGEAVRREPERLPADDSHLMGYVIGRRRALLRNDVKAEARFAESLPQAGMKSDMTIPLRTRGKIIGAFGVGSRSRHAFDPSDFDLLQKSADLTAVAVETQRLLDRTKRLSEIDGLTGVSNHRHFVGLLDQEIEAARRAERSVALLMIDVDDFKRVNDTHGHQAGDELLRHVAQLTAKLLRRSDMIARYGGEEFAVILPDCRLEGAMTAAESIRAEIERSPLVQPPADRPLEARVSVGVATLPEDASSASDLVAAADRALYQAKRTGKNRVCHIPIPTPGR